MPIMLLMTVIVSGSRHTKYNTNRFYVKVAVFCVCVCVHTKYFFWVVIVSYFTLTRQHRHHSDAVVSRHTHTVIVSTPIC